MKISDFSYVLPKALIAQYPIPERDNSRLLCIDADYKITDTTFNKIADYLQAGDLLVLNDTRVIPARLFAKKETGGKVEIMLERILDKSSLLVQLRANKPLKLGTRLLCRQDVVFEISKRQDKLFVLHYLGRQDLFEVFNRYGHIPLPPYINRLDELQDKARYQTVFANKLGAVAAPTAGLHFTQELLAHLQAQEIDNASLTLHVGAGTFQAVHVAEVAQHKMHSEYLSVSQSLVDKVQQTKQQGGRIIAVGTTVVRGLEAAARSGQLQCFEGETAIFIYPSFQFNVVDCLLTNFHLSESTLLMLVCAFAGQEIIMQSYQHAIEQKYRFYSYGDAMLIAHAERK